MNPVRNPFDFLQGKMLKNTMPNKISYGMKTNFSKMGWTLGLFFVALYIICLGWSALIADPALKTLHMQLLALTFPGFVWLSLGSFIWGAVLSFVYGWVGAGIFAFFHKRFCK